MTCPPGTVFDFTDGADGVVVKLGEPGYQAVIPWIEQGGLFGVDRNASAT
jgi:hypothetical protein